MKAWLWHTEKRERLLLIRQNQSPTLLKDMLPILVLIQTKLSRSRWQDSRLQATSLPCLQMEERLFHLMTADSPGLTTMASLSTMISKPWVDRRALEYSSRGWLLKGHWDALLCRFSLCVWKIADVTSAFKRSDVNCLVSDKRNNFSFAPHVNSCLGSAGWHMRRQMLNPVRYSQSQYCPITF